MTQDHSAERAKRHSDLGLHGGLYGPAGADQVRLLTMRIPDMDDEPPVAADACPAARIEVTHVPVKAFFHTTPPPCQQP